MAAEGCMVVRPTSGHRSLFKAAAEPVLEVARRRLDARLFDLAGDDRGDDAG